MNPKVAILLAVYKPNWNFLQQQLDSLIKQDYPHLVLYVCDDSEDPNIHHHLIEHLKHQAFPFPVYTKQNTHNIGSTKTFEALTSWAEGDYFAYCDQDDIWYPHKISTLVRLIQTKHAVLAYSDLEIIDSNNKRTHSSILKANRTLKHVHGDHCFKFLLTRNSVTGCSMLIDSKIAKKALPFEPLYIHDHWLALYASSEGSLVYSKKPLLLYRIHDDNQIGTSHPDITSKEAFITHIINVKISQLESIQQRFDNKLDQLAQKTSKHLLLRKENLVKWSIPKSLYIFMISLYDVKGISIELAYAILSSKTIRKVHTFLS